MCMSIRRSAGLTNAFYTRTFIRHLGPAPFRPCFMAFRPFPPEADGLGDSIDELAGRCEKRSSGSQPGVMGGTVRKYSLICLLWTAYGVFMAVNLHFKSLSWPRGQVPFSDALLGELCYAYVWFLLTPVILMVARRWPIRSESWAKATFIHFLTGAAMGAFSKALYDIIKPLVFNEEVPGLATIARTMFLSVDFGTLNYALIILFYHARDYYARFEESRIRAARLEAQLANAQLQALKMQLHPHFLFNTLHAISELVHEDPSAAESMITRLSDFLRLTLDHVGIPEVTLREEVDFVKRYLEIEKMRFEDRLKIDFDVDHQALEARVPNLILQPLVENALKHGLSRRPEAGALRIGVRRHNGMLCMKVFDNGPGVNPEDRKQFRKGLGLTNTRERLKRLYEENYLMALLNPPAGGFEVTIHIPFRLS